MGLGPGGLPPKPPSPPPPSECAGRWNDDSNASATERQQGTRTTRLAFSRAVVQRGMSFVLVFADLKQLLKTAKLLHFEASFKSAQLLDFTDSSKSIHA